jgi:hypothetical protein
VSTLSTDYTEGCTKSKVRVSNYNDGNLRNLDISSVKSITKSDFSKDVC